MATFRGRSRRTVRAAAIAAALGCPVAAAGAAAVASSSVAAPGGGATDVAPAVASCTAQTLPTLGGQYGNVIAAAANGNLAGIADAPNGTAQPVLWVAGRPERIKTGLAGSVPSGVNAHGDVVGDSPEGENAVGWVWLGGRATMLRGVGKLIALPAAITNSDVIVGALETTEGTPSEGDGTPGTRENEQAAVWRTPASAPTVLAALPGDQGAHAFAVAADGRIGGVSEGSSFRPTVWDRSGKPHALPGLGGGYGAVRAFGPGGVAVGDAVARDGTDHAVMWNADGRIIDLGLPPGSRTAQANGVLPGGVVVGTAEMPAPGGGVLSQAVRWPAAKEPQLLTEPHSMEQNVVAGAASARAAAGYRADPKGGRHPVIWRCGR